MQPYLRLSLCIGIAAYFLLMIRFLKIKALNLKYSLLWIISGIIMLILVIFPELLSQVSTMLGFVSTVNAVFVLIIFFLMCILMSITSIVSRHNTRSKILTQHLALLEKRVRELENYIENNDKRHTL